MTPITLNPSTRQIRASGPILPYHRDMVRHGLPLDAALLNKVITATGDEPDDVIEYVERAIRHEVRRLRMQHYLDELDARLGPVPEELLAEAEAFWREAEAVWAANKPAEGNGSEAGERTVLPEDADTNGRRVRVQLNMDLLARIMDVAEPRQVREFVEKAIRRELREGKSSQLLADLETGVEQELAELATEEDDASWPAG